MLLQTAQPIAIFFFILSQEQPVALISSLCAIFIDPGLVKPSILDQWVWVASASEFAVCIQTADSYHMRHNKSIVDSIMEYNLWL